ncbi:MAG: DUF547 domain-containing protein [Saprospiraceae bacterium]|nr:DUF547 domain-containing protein [Saprospiraceae bacterium]
MRLITWLFSSTIFLACGVSPKMTGTSKPIVHDVWNKLLSKHVDGDGWVDYLGFQQDSLVLNQYLDLLSSAHPNAKNWSRNERLAYWINAYNAFTVKLIVNHYPVESIKDIKNGIPFVNTVWDIKFIQIEDRTYDLNNIEHGIIRKQFDEPRIHFAVNCASVSCPKLLNQAYIATTLDEQLTDAARTFLNDPLRNRLEENKVSSIFSWFSGDFKSKSGSVRSFINTYAPAQLDSEAKLEYLEYNWSLNDSPPDQS